MADGYLLNDRDRELIKEMRRELERRRQNSPTPPANELAEGAAAEVYVAKTPGGGIPALDEGPPPIPGSATCAVYSLLQELSLIHI